ncbi:MAG: hypothetical protein EOO53_14030 [Gammaproteobacteria bacterium]|nr:MAG: hypothetical protein EOO53_14030 [Gammaproteobacteria bacterium]
MSEFYEIGSVCPNCEDDLSFPMALSLVRACKANRYIELIECRIHDSAAGREEVIVIEAGDGTVAHGNVAGIFRNERLAITVTPDNRIPVVVRPLRRAFPALSHQHPTPHDSPRALCLYNASWNSIQRGWTAERFLHRMFWWLRESSELRLHRADQPLEQLFYMSSFQVILPSNHLEFANSKDKFLILEEINSPPNVPITLRAWSATSEQVKEAGVKGFCVLPILVEGVTSMEVASFPENIGALHNKLVTWNSDLYGPLKQVIIQMIDRPEGISKKHEPKNGVLILVSVPRIRDGSIERYDVLGYALTISLFDLAQSLDLIDKPDDKGRYFHTHLIGQPDDVPSSDKWRAIPVQPVEIRVAMGRRQALDISSIEPTSAEFKAILAGVGSLGGLLAEIWIRQGWGDWTFVDPDQLLTHNIPRHVGIDEQLGMPKSVVVQQIAAQIYPNNPVPIPIVGNITDSNDQLSQAFSDATLLVDVTTTFYAPRDLSSRDNVPRVASLFLTPSGNGCVMLLEDSNRTVRASAIEGQYYRAILNSDWGVDHLKNHFGDVWVGGGCRDISVRLPYERIHLHAGILSSQLRVNVLSSNARACVWVVNEKTGAVTANEIELHPVSTQQCGEWIVIYDDAITEKLNRLRKEALPQETGGIILGVTDMPSKSILIVDIVDAPEDSKSGTSHFIRGREGQEDLLKDVLQKTANIVDYVGEWHSHPNGYSTKPSADDNKLLNGLSDLMARDGLPGLMLIVGDTEVSIYAS